jgi:hypothetical protein
MVTLGSFWKSENLLPSVSTHAANQPWLGIGILSSDFPPRSRTWAMEASMSSVSKYTTGPGSSCIGLMAPPGLAPSIT